MTDILLPRLTRALTTPITAKVGKDIVFDPDKHEQLGIQSSQQRGLLKLADELAEELADAEDAFEKAPKHSNEEESAEDTRQKLTWFLETVIDLLDGSIVFQFGEVVGNYESVEMISDGSIVGVIKKTDEPEPTKKLNAGPRNTKGMN